MILTINRTAALPVWSAAIPSPPAAAVTAAVPAAPATAGPPAVAPAALLLEAGRPREGGGSRAPAGPRARGGAGLRLGRAGHQDLQRPIPHLCAAQCNGIVQPLPARKLHVCKPLQQFSPCSPQLLAVQLHDLDIHI